MAATRILVVEDEFLIALDIAVVLPVLIVLVVVGVLTFVVRQYKRCPSNRILVVYGKVGGSQAARCIHGGGVRSIDLTFSLGNRWTPSVMPGTVEL